jgi:hypothetical protein
MKYTLLVNTIVLHAIAILPFAIADSAQALTFTGSSGNLAASAVFNKVSLGNNKFGLEVILTNTSTFDVVNPSQVLTGLFFNTPNPLNLVPKSATLANGSQVFYADQPANDVVVGREWAYKSNISNQAPFNYNQGIGAAGFGIFGPHDRFESPDLSGNNNDKGSLAGIDYGLLSAGDDPKTGNQGGIEKSGGLVKNSVAFLMLDLPANFDVSSIDEVCFQYGSGLKDYPCIKGTQQIPTPSLLLGLLATGWKMLGKKKSEDESTDEA